MVRTGEPDGALQSRLRDLEEAMGPEGLEEVVGLFLEDTPPRLEALRLAVELGDGVTLEAEAHALKGSSSCLGAVAMSSACRTLEELGRAGGFAAAQPVMPALRKEFDHVKALLGRPGLRPA